MCWTACLLGQHLSYCHLTSVPHQAHFALSFSSPSLACTLVRSASRVCLICAYISLGLFVRAVAHTIILVYELICLNIAINAFDNSLLTLLLSNQFVEIKGSVFKKFEKDNLFQITCAGTPAQPACGVSWVAYTDTSPEQILWRDSSSP
jgi:hypothetical protein